MGRITGWGLADGYFDGPHQAGRFASDQKWLLVHLRAAFSSPVWFNIGLNGVAQQAPACFILSAA